MSDTQTALARVREALAKCRFDDGMGRGAMLDYWYEFDRKLDAALAQIEQEKANGSR